MGLAGENRPERRRGRKSECCRRLPIRSTRVWWRHPPHPVSGDSLLTTCMCGNGHSSRAKFSIC
ncbi:hypothetical protein AB395_00003422 [Sinorhizobium fredii CCBAU 45436]|nr:hypothetical protein SF83666_c32540 [Sinorhizobium fredii CCBAU 83666]AWI59057.1 hypothetical protein AB395_00003422 [Sinorhizobium fredii CCBAU 45436]